MRPWLAKLILFLAVLLPTLWTIHVHLAGKDTDLTSSWQSLVWCRREPWLAWLWGFAAALLLRDAYPPDGPPLKSWDLLLIVVGAAAVGHCLFPQTIFIR